MPPVRLLYGTAHIDWPTLCALFARAPLGERDPDRLRAAAENSHTVCSAVAGETVIGFGRALSDGQYQSAIYDVVVEPAWQGRGIGRLLVEGLLARLPLQGPVLLYAVPGREDFYRKLGFADLTTGMGLFPDPRASLAKGYIR